jgi:hypothetical protein
MSESVFDIVFCPKCRVLSHVDIVENGPSESVPDIWRHKQFICSTCKYRLFTLYHESVKVPDVEEKCRKRRERE